MLENLQAPVPSLRAIQSDFLNSRIWLVRTHMHLDIFPI